VIGLVVTEAIAVLANHVALRPFLSTAGPWWDRNAVWSELTVMCRFGGLRLFGLNLAASIAIVVVPSIVIVLCASPAMGLFGNEYRAGRMTLVILSASSVAVVLNNLLGQILVSRGVVMGRFMLDVLLAAVLAIASWQLIPIYRDQGMALASLIAFAVTSAALIPMTVSFMRRHANPLCRP